MVNPLSLFILKINICRQNHILKTNKKSPHPLINKGRELLDSRGATLIEAVFCFHLAS
jgi:hypothetical protein